MLTKAKYSHTTILISLSILFVGCFSSIDNEQEVGTYSWEKIAENIVGHKNKVSTFSQQGPLAVHRVDDYTIQLSPNNQLTTDLYSPKKSGSAPLIIMVHGNKFNRKVHSNQCDRLASWGFYCLTVDVPNQHQWLKNARHVEELATLIHSYPNIISKNIIANKIILVGHSFGGSAVTVAAGRGAPVAGLILLDPAVVHPSVAKYMKKIKSPVILLGADQKVFSSRRRKLFYKNIAGPMSEVTVSQATHNDAQSPSIGSVNWGFDFTTTEKYQKIFQESIVASAFSIASSSNVKQAWRAFRPYLKNGKLKKGRFRSAKISTNKSSH